MSKEPHIAPVFMNVCNVGHIVQSLPSSSPDPRCFELGPGAWDKYTRPAPDDYTTPNRLVVHKVDDATNPTYAREVALFLKDAKMCRIAFSTCCLCTCTDKAHANVARRMKARNRRSEAKPKKWGVKPAGEL